MRICPPAPLLLRPLGGCSQKHVFSAQDIDPGPDYAEITANLRWLANLS